MDRASLILGGVDIDSLVGLEIGPLDRPLVKRENGRQIYYADYAEREVLCAASATDLNVNIENIPEIDFIVAPLPETVGRKFDYIVASHVAEHVPDLIGWLKTISTWLNSGGLIILALPDKRYTFDCFREVSTVGQLLEAHVESRKRPSFASIYDGFSKAVHVDGWYLWEGVEPPKPFERVYTIEQSLNLARDAYKNKAYRDCHCWVFTSETFAKMLEEVRQLGVFDFEWKKFVHPVKYSVEFYVSINPKL